MNSYKKYLLTLLPLGIMLFTVISCDTNDPPTEGSLTLTLEDVSCIEAWIRLTTSNIQLPVTVTIKQNNQTKSTIKLVNSDTLLYIDSLLPNQTYQYQAASIEKPATSNELSVTTMDTTSHDFTFETFTFGGTAGSSVLYDVAIINENDIWAVGEIYVADTSQNGYTTYNAVHWDGNEWELIRINMESTCNPVVYPPLRTIWAFSESNIVVTSGGSIGWFDGIANVPDCNIRPLLTGAINKIWGSSSSDLYVVGNSGNIGHYNGTNWQQIESGTDTDLKDIFGTPDGKSVWAAGYEDFKPTVLLNIMNTQVKTVFSSRDYLFVFDSNNISGGIGSVWAKNNNFVFLTTWYSLYRKAVYTDSSQAQALKSGNPTILFGLKSRGTNTNDIFTIGSKNNIHHYNGTTFKTYYEPLDNSVTYYGLDVKANISVSCGQRFENGISDKAIIVIGKRI